MLTPLIEFFKYMIGCISPKAGIADVTIVRRYKTECGYVGELYVNGRKLGMTCDSFIGGIEMYKQPLAIGYEGGRRVVATPCYTLCSGEFTSPVPCDVCYVGSETPEANQFVMPELLNAVASIKTIRLTVLNRVLVEY